MLTLCPRCGAIVKLVAPDLHLTGTCECTRWIQERMRQAIAPEVEARRLRDELAKGRTEEG
jgi:hypothetical protein